MQDVADRLTNRVQLTTDGHVAYLQAVEGAFGAAVDYAQLVKHYGPEPEQEKRYSPAVCVGAHKESVEGRPDKRHISTSYIERQNLTMRMHMRRFTRLTNAFSKKIDNHAHAVALHFMFYNFVRIHKTLECSPAMAAGVTNRLWELKDIVKLIDDAAPSPGPRGAYKKRTEKGEAMPNFGVRCFDSAIWDRVEHDPIEAESALDAAMRVCGERLVPDGKLGQLRAEVWPTSDPSAKETFYMPPIDRNSN